MVLVGPSGSGKSMLPSLFLGPASRDFLLETLGKMSMKIGLQYLYKLA